MINKIGERKFIDPTDANIRSCINEGWCKGKSWGNSMYLSDCQEYQHLFTEQVKAVYLTKTEQS
jgi:hypothetical protein